MLEDLPVVKELTKEVWGGNDYIHYVWEDWLAEPANLVFVMELGGRVVGLYCLRLLESQKGRYGWWQGVRVDPAFQRQGLAARILEHALNESRARKLGGLRFATGETNVAMHRLADRYNFRYLAPYTFLVGPRLEGLAPEETFATPVRTLTADEFELAWNFIETAESWQAGPRIFCETWVWKDLDAATVRDWLGQNQVYGYFEGEKVTALALVKLEEEPENFWSFVSWLDGTPAAIQNLTRFLHREASRRAHPSQKTALDVMLVTNEAHDQLLQEAGLRLDPDDRMRLYELPLEAEQRS